MEICRTDGKIEANQNRGMAPGSSSQLKRPGLRAKRSTAWSVQNDKLLDMKGQVINGSKNPFEKKWGGPIVHFFEFAQWTNDHPVMGE